MRERVHHLNGVMEIDSSPGGTQVLIAFPIAAEPADGNGAIRLKTDAPDSSVVQDRQL